MPDNNPVITGMGIVSSIGIGRDAYYKGLLQKNSGIQSLSARVDGGAKPNANSEPAGLWIGGPIVDFDPKQYVRPRKALKVMCREIQTAFAASQLAIDDAGLSEMFPIVGGDIPAERVGTVFGSEMLYGSPAELADTIRGCCDEDGAITVSKFGAVAMRGVMPLWMLKYLPNMAACHVGISIGAHGPNNSLVVGDVSGPAAMIEAMSCIDRGIADVMISGAAGTRINTARMNYRNDLAIPDVAESVESSSRPHDPRSRGVVGGEGAATIVLESAAHARSRNAVPVAEIAATARCFIPATGMREPLRSDRIDRPGQRGSCEAIAKTIQLVLTRAKIDPSSVGMVVSHAMGDPVIDAAEKHAIESTVPDAPLVAPIANLGHTGAASGTIEVVTGALAIYHQTVMPSRHNDSSARPLLGSHVLCLSHSAEGNAIATLLAAPTES